jgi:hypothetical protein
MRRGEMKKIKKKNEKKFLFSTIKMTTLQFQEDVFFSDPEMEPFMPKPRHLTTLSRPTWTQVFPTSQASFTVATSQSSAVNFQLPRSGYLCAAGSYMPYLEITLSPSANASVEPYASIARFDQQYNATSTTSKFNHPYKCASLEVLDTPADKLQAEGGQYGVAATGNQYEPFVNSVSSSQAVSTSGATAASAPNYIAAGASKSFMIPLNLIADGIIVDQDSLLALGNIQTNEIQFSMLPTANWCSQIGATPGAVVMTVSNVSLWIARTTISAESNNMITSLMSEGRLVLHTLIKATASQNITVSSGTQNVQFSGMPNSIRFLEVVAELPTARALTNIGYKGLTCVDSGITSYQFALDSVVVSERPISVLRGEAYQSFLSCRLGKMRVTKDVQRLSGPVVSPYIFSGVGSSVNTTGVANYPSSDSDASGDYVIFNRAFRMCADLGSVNQNSYSGSKAQIIDLQITSNGSLSTYTTPNSTFTPSNSVNFIAFALSNARLIFGLGSLRVEM